MLYGIHSFSLSLFLSFYHTKNDCHWKLV